MAAARGRVSAAAAQAVVVPGRFGHRPEPPADLTEAQAEIWRQTAASEAADFFNTAALRSLLKEYCRHTLAAGVLAAQIDAFNPEWLGCDEGLKRYDLLLKMRDRETKAAADKATKLRLTNQSRYTPQAAATAASKAGPSAKPWEYGKSG